MRKNCRITSFLVFGSYVKISFLVVHGNLGLHIRHQENQNKSNSQGSIFGPKSMGLYYSGLQERGQALLPTLLSLSDHSVSLPQSPLAEPAPKHSLPPLRASHVFRITELPGFDLGEEVFPISTQRKNLSYGRENEPHPSF